MAGDVRGPFLIWILFQKKGPATKQSSIKESAGGRKGSSDIQHLQTSVDLEVRNHIKNNGKSSLPRVLEIANTAIFRSICLFRDRLYLGYRGGLASCHLEDMFVGTRRLGSGFNVWGIILFLPRLALLYSIRRLDMKVVLPVFPNTSLADSIFSYGKNLTQEHVI